MNQTKETEVAFTEVKRPKSSYIFYTMSEERNKIIEEFKNKNMKFSTKEVLVELGARWKKMTDAEKEPFKKLASMDKERYEKQADSTKNKYITGYQLYCNENMQRVKNENPGLKGELGYKYIKILANEWKHLSKKETDVYNKRSDEMIHNLK